MTDLSTGSELSDYDFSANDHTTADTCSKRHHYQILASGSAALPHFTKCCHIRIISKCGFHSGQLFQFFFCFFIFPSKIGTSIYHTFCGNRCRNSDSDSLVIFFRQMMLFHLPADRCCNIRKDRFSFIFCLCHNFPFISDITILSK